MGVTAHRTARDRRATSLVASHDASQAAAVRAPGVVFRCASHVVSRFASLGASLVVLPVVALLFATTARAEPSAPTHEHPGAVRLFVPTLRTTAVDHAVANALMTRILVAARAHDERFAVISAADLKAVLDVEAERQASGCDSESCASEIAAALDAPQLLVVTLDHVGERWVLTLTRADRIAVRVLAQKSREVRGASPEELLDVAPGLVDDVLGTPPSHLVVGGGIACAVGATTAALGFVPLALAWSAYGSATSALRAKQADKAQDEIDDGRGWTSAAQGFWIGGGVVGGIGVGLLTFGIGQGGAE